MLMSALKKSIKARIAIRMFGKVRNVLNRATIPGTKPLPRTAKTATIERSTRMKVARDEKSTSMTVGQRQASTILVSGQ